jgi:hypothetical protein
MKTKSIRQAVSFPGAKPAEVYALLMNARQHRAFTGSKVKMNPKVEGRFEVFGGYCYGFNIELKEGKKLCRVGILPEKVGPMIIFPHARFALIKQAVEPNSPFRSRPFRLTKQQP